MKAVILNELVTKYHGEQSNLDQAFSVQTNVPIPKPKYNQVLIKVQRAQINPSDTSWCQGRYGVPTSPGQIPGFECCGTVVKSGGSLYGWSLKGKRVAVFAQGACWAEYVVAEAFRCIPVTAETSWQNAAGAIANPVTAVQMLKLSKNEKCVVITGGASSLAKQFIRAAKSRGISTIAIVRKEDQVAPIRDDVGAKIVLNSSSETFAQDLTQACKDNKVKVGFDMVAGDVGAKVFSALIAGGELHVLGFLSGQPIPVTGADLIFKRKTMRGLYLGSVMRAGLWELYKTRSTVVQLLATDFATDVQATFTLDQIVDALRAYTTNLSGGKVQLIIGTLENKA